ncbi:MAG: hydrogenase maturation nickel metallochaperone HypA [Nitrospiraceae bacterium]|nr:hydrogenase maturation nickel metallochaperone HypA [Nitrospiraceae bacterium]
MHEVSIAQSIIEIVSGQCRKGGYSGITSIRVRIGRASGIMPDALLFAFDAIKVESPATGAVLEIEEVCVSGRCRDCGRDFSVEEEYVLNCPLCGGPAFEIKTGREMEIIDMEVTE